MKKALFVVLLCCPFALPAQNAQIRIGVSRVKGDVDPKIYGVFMEPIEFKPGRNGPGDTFRPIHLRN